ncbi:hypothetical protein KP509_18G084000 [Ceratopteris richardii]|uniref:Uncharacterized protein n=1 Tax=Ceratopteris richardii TaxID=49495 RepID=A0A8T2ST04_CERRI|nr:hypothetical protein KP509_18G084000 [Ceratopteris richardii]
MALPTIDGLLACALRRWRHRDDKDASKQFERQARGAKMQALKAAALHKLSGVLGIMAMTWATVVLLGGLVSDLSTWDFYLISALLLAESVRLFVIEILLKLVSRILYREKTDPAEFEFKDERPELVTKLHFRGQASSGGIAFVCLLFTFHRISKRGSSPFSPEDGSKHMGGSLWIFYIIVTANFTIAILSAALHLFFRWCQRIENMSQRNKRTNSLATFYDTIYRTAIKLGITEAGEVDLLDFAFDKIASDLKRNIRPLLVRNLNRQMITYMYENNGVLVACQYLKGDDLWKRIAAANLAGFWYEEKKVDTNQELFWSLSERVFGAGGDANASLNSIESLARHWSREEDERPHPFLVGIPNRGNVLDTIVNLVLMETRSSLHFRVRAFEACCRDSRVREYLYRQVDPHSEQPLDGRQICRCLAELVVKQVSPEARPKVAVSPEWWSKINNSNLAKLCNKLAIVLSPKSESVRVIARFYSARALMLLLLHGDDKKFEFNLCVAVKLRRWIKTRVVLDESHSYYVKADVEAAEKVLAWVGLPHLKWNSVKVIEYMAEGMQVLKRQALEGIISAARGTSPAVGES